MRIRRIHVLVGLVTLAVWAGLVLVHLENRELYMSGSVVLFMLGLIGGGALALIGGVLVLCRRTAWPLVVGVLLLVVTFGSLTVAGRITRRQLPHAKDAGRPLVDAIERFVAEGNGPPPDLVALVPEYIDSIPRCPLGLTGRDYRYFTREDEYRLWFPTISGTRWIWDRENDRWRWDD